MCVFFFFTFLSLWPKIWNVYAKNERSMTTCIAIASNKRMVTITFLKSLVRKTRRGMNYAKHLGDIMEIIMAAS